MAKYTVVLNSCGENEDEVIGLIASVVGVDSEAVRDKVSSLPCELCTSDNFEKIEELTSAIKSAGGTTNTSSNDLVESTEENNNLEESKISSNKNDDPYILGEALVWILGTAILCIFAWILQPLLEWVGWIAPIAFFLFFPTTFGSTKKTRNENKRKRNKSSKLSF